MHTALAPGHGEQRIAHSRHELPLGGSMRARLQLDGGAPERVVGIEDHEIVPARERATALPHGTHWQHVSIRGGRTPTRLARGV